MLLLLVLVVVDSEETPVDTAVDSDDNRESDVLMPVDSEL